MAFLVVGGTISIIADLVFLGDVEYWRLTGLTADPPGIAMSIGRASQAIDFLTRWLEAAGFAILAVGLLYLGLLWRRRPELPRSVEVLAYIEALLLVGIAIAGAGKSDTSYQVLSLLTGVIIAPVLTVVLGMHLGRLARR